MTSKLSRKYKNGFKNEINQLSNEAQIRNKILNKNKKAIKSMISNQRILLNNQFYESKLMLSGVT